MSELGRNLRHIREYRQLGTRELARLADVQPSTITRIEQGENPRLDSVVKIAQALQMKVDDLLTRIDFDVRIHGPVGDAYAQYDSDPRAGTVDGFAAFADAVGDLLDRVRDPPPVSLQPVDRLDVLEDTVRKMHHAFGDRLNDCERTIKELQEAPEAP